MKVLPYDHILKTLNLPTVEWEEFFEGTSLTQDMLWTVKVEERVMGVTSPAKVAKQESLLQQLEKKIKRIISKKNNQNECIGVDAATAMAFAEKMRKKMDTRYQMVLYYPYYTVVKSGVLDLNCERTVIEATKGEVHQLIEHNQIDMTMILDQENVEIIGDDKFLPHEDVLTLIDHSREVKQMMQKDMNEGKNIQLYFSYVYYTREEKETLGELKLIFYKFKMF